MGLSLEEIHVNYTYTSPKLSRLLLLDYLNRTEMDIHDISVPPYLGTSITYPMGNGSWRYCFPNDERSEEGETEVRSPEGLRPQGPRVRAVAGKETAPSKREHLKIM